VHDRALWSRIRDGELSVREAARARAAVVAELVERAAARSPARRGRRATRCEHGVAMNLGGGTHHAGRDFARGYCLFNDVAVALARCARRPRRRALVVDCDVHQGDGTAQILAGPDAVHALAARARAN
jgi:acetoin utilization deacetylase AcuC-like enzyme